MARKLAIISPILFVTLATAWPWTLHRAAYFTFFRNGGRPVSVEFGRGEIYVAGSNVPLGTDVEWSFACHRFSSAEQYSGAASADENRLNPEKKDGSHSLYYGETTGLLGRPNWGYFVIAAPIWSALIALILIGGPAIATEYRRVHRPLIGQCQKCGYDLRDAGTLSGMRNRKREMNRL